MATELFGHIKSLERSGDHYLLRFDPAWFTSGATANTAAADDGAVEPGQPVPNDNYVVDESHRLLTYLVPETADVTILTTGGTGPLYQIDLLAALELGVRLVLGVNTRGCAPSQAS